MAANQKPSNKHHYVPRSYLASFTEGGKTDSVFLVIKSKTEVRKATPASVAFQKGLYSVDVPGVNTDIVEKWIGDNIEGPATQVIKKMQKSLSLPKQGTPEFEILIKFVGLLYLRHPSIHDMMERGLQEITEKILSLTFQSEEHFQAVVSNMRADGINVSGYDYKSLKVGIDRDAFIIKLNQNTYIKQLLDNLPLVVEILSKRPWDLLISDNGDFICSDSPFSMEWDRKEGFHTPPGLSSPKLMLVLPLSRRIVLLSDANSSNISKTANRNMVDTINNIIYKNARREIYVASLEKLNQP